VDLLYQGEFLPDGQPLTATRLVGSGRDAWKTYAGYTFGYNDSLFAQRVHDVLSVVSFVKHYETKPERIHLAGFGPMGVVAAAAATQAGDALDRLAIDTGRFRFAKLTAINDPMFFPGAVKYGDVPALVQLAAARDVWLAGEDDTTAKRIAAGSQKITVATSPPDDRPAAAAEWLVR
jgi:hypothetical protein